MTLAEIEKAFLERVRVWWRPVACIGIAGGVVLNAIILPAINGEAINMTDFAATIVACSTAFAVREWGKINGAS